MNIILCLLGIALLGVFVSFLGFKKLLNNSFASNMIESYVLLVGQALRLFNRRLVSILLQVIAITNIIYFLFFQLLPKKLTFVWEAMLIFDFTIILFSGIIAIILYYVPNAVSAISAKLSGQKTR